MSVDEELDFHTANLILIPSGTFLLSQNDYVFITDSVFYVNLILFPC